jgi:hypothetical protein
MSISRTVETVWTSGLDACRLLFSACVSTVETVDIILHEDQFDQVLLSLSEIKRGDVFTLAEAFDDLD